MVLPAKGNRAIGNRDIVIRAIGDLGHRNSGHRISGSRIRDFGVLPLKRLLKIVQSAGKYFNP